ncbi:MAG: NAD(P)-binding protein, partial [Deltaproteobacteria bacterium]|nr:NAD(P)-binding protein [Deltaproteobacteria bacterium]
MPRTVDVLVVGAGFSGAVLAERLAEAHGLHCLVLDRRDHPGGLAHDTLDANGVRVHAHGPHWFRTADPAVQAYLERFATWRPVGYRILARHDGRDWPFPPNLATFEQLVGRPATADEFERWLEAQRVPCAAPRNAEEWALAHVGRELFRRFYRGYTRKQWGREPRELDPTVPARVPLRLDRDERAFVEPFQALPEEGFARLFAGMLDHPRIELRLQTEWRAIRRQVRARRLVWTGPLDEYFEFRHGPLPYRSLRFERETVFREWFQGAPQVNYPDDEPWTRIAEPKHVTGPQPAGVTTIVREYPQARGPGDEPYYPLPTAEARALAARYAADATAAHDVTFVGR